MMFKESKGVTLIALIITIIIMIILAGATIATSELIDRAQEQQIVTNLALIQTKVKIIMEKASFSGDSSFYVGVLQTSGEYEGMYEYTENVLRENGLDAIANRINGEKYYVDYTTGDIIYSKGETELWLSDFM